MTETSTHLAGDPGAADPAGVHFERLLVSLSARFINLPAEDMDGEVEAAQRLICQCLALDRSTLWQFSDSSRTTLQLTHHVPGPSAMPVGINAVEAFPWLSGRVLRREATYVRNIDSLPAGAERDKAGLRHNQTRSTAIVPVVASERTIGCLTFAMTTRERVWSKTDKRRFELVAQVFANALDRKRADRELRQALAEVRQLRDQLDRENVYLRQAMKGRHNPARVVGRSAAICSALNQARQVAPTPATVLLLGETGVGKELLADFIHDASPRRNRLTVRVNCSAIPTALIESELFGREKGAYTGALSKQIGRFELAHGSTIFLDEIGDLPIETQLKLLRALQERQIERLGSPRPLPVDVRIIAATNRDLEGAVERGAFRQDLYYRCASRTACWSPGCSSSASTGAAMPASTAGRPRACSSPSASRSSSRPLRSVGEGSFGRSDRSVRRDRGRRSAGCWGGAGCSSGCSWASRRSSRVRGAAARRFRTAAELRFEIGVDQAGGSDTRWDHVIQGDSPWRDTPNGLHDRGLRSPRP